jgi:hypothetical protein
VRARWKAAALGVPPGSTKRLEWRQLGFEAVDARFERRDHGVARPVHPHRVAVTGFGVARYAPHFEEAALQALHELRRSASLVAAAHRPSAAFNSSTALQASTRR